MPILLYICTIKYTAPISLMGLKMTTWHKLYISIAIVSKGSKG